MDLVAAPLAIQSHREMVMDFTIPFFFEFMALLVKKPDPNATKWKTLIRPFSSTVYLLIGVALLVTSIIMCILEKYNPYYNKIADKRKGLLLFYDSFWYMFGALFAQGNIDKN